MADRVGQQLGNYSLIRLLGEGGFAEVYLGEHIYLKTQAAIKVLQMRLASEDREGFLEEARTIAGLKHPHIIRVLDFGIEAGTPFLVMDYAPNGTLRKRHPKGTRLPLSIILSYVEQVAPALQYAHERQLVHRDVKPENLLLGEDNQVLLSDFGIALVTQSSRYQSTQEIVGTAAYMAPEQLQGKPRRASDQYALGIIVYEWLCGDRPFHGTFTELFSQHLLVPPPPLREKVPTISPAVEQVVLTALEKDAHKRFASVQDFANALETTCGEVLALPNPGSDSLTELRFDGNPAARGTIQLEMLNQATAAPGSMRQPSITPDGFASPSLTSKTSGHTPATNGPQMPLPQLLPSSSEAPPVTQPVLPLPPTKQHRRRNIVVASVSLLLVVALVLGVILSRSLANRNSTLISTPPPAHTNTATAANSPTVTVTATPTAQATAPATIKTWHLQHSGTSQDLWGIAWSGSQFVVVGRNGTILTSPNGITWTAQNSGTNELLASVVWSGSQFVAVGTLGTILTSPDGRTWTPQNSNTGEWLHSVAWSGSQFVAVGFAGTLVTSPDGRAWATQNSGTAQELFGVAWSKSQFVAVGRGLTILTSPNGRVWATQDSSSSGVDTRNVLLGVTGSSSQFVVVGDNGTILTSPDGHAWTAQNSGTSTSLRSIAWSDSQFVALGWRFTIRTSPDGITWMAQNSGTPQYLSSVTGAGSQFVAVGDAGTILTSP
jgi:serine/threonine protein kinase